MQWTITKQVIVEAETPEEAAVNGKDAPTAAILSIQPRPQQQNVVPNLPQGQVLNMKTGQVQPKG